MHINLNFHRILIFSFFRYRSFIQLTANGNRGEEMWSKC